MGSPLNVLTVFFVEEKKYKRTTVTFWSSTTQLSKNSNFRFAAKPLINKETGLSGSSLPRNQL